MASQRKKRRTERNVEKDWLYAMMKICTYINESHVTLTPLKIECCNAITSCGTSFSKAFCDTKPYEVRLLFGDVFQSGISILRDFEENKKVPEDRRALFAFNKLRDVLNGDRSLGLRDPLTLKSMSETELTVLVANHLLGKLTASACFLIDNGCSGNRGNHCFCGEDGCKLTGTYGDTSIGNPEVWHGNLAIIINGMAVEPLDEQPTTPETPGGESPAEVQFKSTWRKNPPIIAQSIVFSFLQKKRHPDREHFVTPCIGIGRSELIVMLYDSEHDVLLESSTIPLFENEFSCEFSYCAILVCWLTLNYQYFCSGLVEKYKMLKSNFFDIAKEKMTVYEEKLQFQNVKSYQFLELELRNPPVTVKPDVSPFMHETQKVLFEKYLRLNRSDDNEREEEEFSVVHPMN